MKIVHISDLHLDGVHKRTNYRKSLKLLEFASDNGFDHMIISGDITENAEKESLDLARRLFKRFGLLKPDKFSLVIGNHDIFGGVHFAEDVLNFPKKCKTTDYDYKVNEFNSYFKETFEKTHNLQKRSYPFIKELDNAVLFGLNSIARYSVFKNPFASNGEIEPEQLADFEKIAGSEKYNNKIKIAVVHHHFCKNRLTIDTVSNSFWQKVERQTMKLRSKKSIIKLFKKHNINLVLHGHLHESAEYTRKGIKFLNAGGSILGANSDELNLNYININSKEFKTRIQSIPFTPDSIPVKKNYFGLNDYTEIVHSGEINLN